MQIDDKCSENSKSFDYRSMTSKDILHLDKDFKINAFFDETEIRIIGSNKFPLFYADDVAKAFKIDRVDNFIHNFDETEIINPTMQKKLGIITFRDNGVPQPRTLFTEFGVYRFLNLIGGEASKRFRTWQNNILYEARVKEKAPISNFFAKFVEPNDIISEKTMKRIKDEIEQQMLRQEKYKSLMESLCVFEISNNPRLCIQDVNLHDEDLDEADQHIFGLSDFNSENTIDNYEAYTRMLKQYPQLTRVECKYKFVINPSSKDYEHYNLIYRVYCLNAKVLLKQIQHDLRYALVDCSDGDIFDITLDDVKRIVKNNAILERAEHDVPVNEKILDIFSESALDRLLSTQ